MANPLDTAVEQLGRVLAVRKDAFDAVRAAAKTHEGIYMSSGVASRLISIMDAAKVVLDLELATPAESAAASIGGGGADENPLAVAHEVLNDWLDDTDASDIDQSDVAHLFGMLGTAGYSIVPNAAASPTGVQAGQAQGWISVDERPKHGQVCWVAVGKNHQLRFGGAVVLRKYMAAEPGIIDERWEDGHNPNIAISSTTHYLPCAIPAAPADEAR
jgi:hypothetical protein